MKAWRLNCSHALGNFTCWRARENAWPRNAPCRAVSSRNSGPGWLHEVCRREGRYLLRSNLCAEDPAQIWQLYILLTQIEEAFKTLKGDLARAPDLSPRGGPH